MNLPVITEATNEFYRNVYADEKLGPIFRGINMIVLRRHVSYFIHQITMFDCPMTPRQIEYLTAVHAPIIAKHGATQEHFDIMVKYLVSAMHDAGAEGKHLHLVKAKLRPLRDIFPLSNSANSARGSGSSSSSSVDGSVTLHEVHKDAAQGLTASAQLKTNSEQRDCEGEHRGEVEVPQQPTAGGQELLEKLKQLSMQRKVQRERRQAAVIVQQALQQQQQQQEEAGNMAGTAVACCRRADLEQQLLGAEHLQCPHEQQQQQHPATAQNMHKLYGTTGPNPMQQDSHKAEYQTLSQPVKKKSWFWKAFSCVR